MELIQTSTVEQAGPNSIDTMTNRHRKIERKCPDDFIAAGRSISLFDPPQLLQDLARGFFKPPI
jgi:hypothetical protein